MTLTSVRYSETAQVEPSTGVIAASDSMLSSDPGMLPVSVKERDSGCVFRSECRCAASIMSTSALKKSRF